MNELSPYSIRRTGIPPPAQATKFNEPGGEDVPEPHFWDLWRVVRKRKQVIAIFFFTVVATVSVVTLLMTPIYTSEATVLIDQKQPQVVDIKQVLSESIGATEKYNYYDTQ